jgi:hypothetical protein
MYLILGDEINIQPEFNPLIGDRVEFMSDKQVESGPTTGEVVAREKHKVLFLLANDSNIWLDIDLVKVKELTTVQNYNYWILE